MYRARGAVEEGSPGASVRNLDGDIDFEGIFIEFPWLSGQISPIRGTAGRAAEMFPQREIEMNAKAMKADAAGVASAQAGTKAELC